jgi:nucleotide-binding universal stress UspA family protein
MTWPVWKGDQRMIANIDPSEAHRVVVGVDASESSEHAAFWAAREASMRGVPLTLAHALHLPTAAVAPYEPPELAEDLQAAGRELVSGLSARIRERYPDLEVNAEFSPASPTRMLLGTCAPGVLVVTGNSGHGVIKGLLLGSVSRAVALHPEGPVVVVRGPKPQHTDGAVVFGASPSPGDTAIDYAFAAARRYAAPLRVVRAWMPAVPPTVAATPMSAMALGISGPGAVSTPLQTSDSDAEEAADVARAIEPYQAKYPDVEVEISAAAGDPAAALAEAGADARLVVLGARRHGPLSLGLSSVAEALLSRSSAPIAVIPPCDGELS